MTPSVGGSQTRWRPIDLLVAAYSVVLLVVLMALAPRLTWQLGFVLLHVVSLLVARWGARAWPTAVGLRRVVVDFYPMVLVPLCFAELAFVIRGAYPDLLYDAALQRLDVAMFGSDPLLWFDGWRQPWLTELLFLCYLSFYFLPPWVCVYLYRRRDPRFSLVAFEYVGCFLLSYLGYLLVPAIGPRFFLTGVEPLHGLLLFDWLMHAMNTLEAGARDCFPSGHTAVTLLVIVHAVRFARPLCVVLLPVSAGLLLATVYLRLHYVIDLLAGALLAVSVLVCFPLLDRAWQRRRQRRRQRR